MSDNQDALRCAENHQKIARMNGGIRSVFISQKSLLDSSEHIRRLVAENETLKEMLLRGREVWIASAETWSRDVAIKDALLRQAVEAWDSDEIDTDPVAAVIGAIRLHLEAKE